MDIYCLERKHIELSRELSRYMLYREVVNEKEVIDNYMEFFEEVAIPNVPKYIFGHSLGGLYATRMAQMNSEYFKGSVLVNPLLEFGPGKATTFQKLRLNFNNRIENDKNALMHPINDLTTAEFSELCEVERTLTVDGYL